MFYQCNDCKLQDEEAEFSRIAGVNRCPECNSMEVSEIQESLTSGKISENIVKGVYQGESGVLQFRKDCETLLASGTNLNSDQLQTIWDKVCENPFFSDVSIGLFVRYQDFFFFAHEILSLTNVSVGQPAKDINSEIVTQQQDDLDFMFDND